MARTPSSTDHASRVLAARWPALAAFALLVMTTQVLWLTFAAVTPQTATHLGVSEGAVGDLAVVNAAMFVLLAIPTGRWMDRSYERALAAGALFTAVGAIVRALDPSSYAVILTGQVIMSVGQPLVLNALTKVAARHFPDREQTTAISVAAGAQYAGILVAVLTSAWLVDAGGFRLLLVSHAVLAVVAAAAVLLSLRLPAHAVDVLGRARLGELRRDPLVWKMAGLLFLGFGIYNGIATWLDSILVDFGHPGLAGPVIATMTLAGIAGAAVLPGLAAARDARRTVALGATATLAVVMVALAATQPVWLVYLGLALVGFMLMGTLPVVLDWSELHVGPTRAGTVTGMLLLAGNLGAVLVVLTVQLAIGDPTAALVVMAAWAVPGFVVAWLLPRRQGARGRA
ncbi:MFS transporter [Aeromicrobium tamlense]|uniref:MFS family arabinose efflux permease n=1 Tax=Aeromicrobium tamlense TaxID=375541 RepID=A0A8I0FWT8_9ACTN|nr:MFS transporter [Aeromicrobium tamlense]MBD1272114.1 MFS transporter [Aeromicrobium tamlense]NYI38692.1 putative MFS family arabinose efflux permease [Aeromicrobium tamlense]